MAEDPVTWSDLKTSLRLWCDSDTGGIADAQLEECIAFAERKFNRVLRVPEMEATATITLDAATESLPADFLALRAAYINTDPKTILEQMSLDELRTRYPDSATGRPQFFSIQSGSTMVFGPAPDTSYSLIVNYYQKIPALSGSVADNWLLLAHPDLYLAMSLAEIFAFRMDEERLALWNGRAEVKLEEIRRQGQSKAYGAAPQRIRSPIVV